VTRSRGRAGSCSNGHYWSPVANCCIRWFIWRYIL
jgi:hypothetical protein